MKYNLILFIYISTWNSFSQVKNDFQPSEFFYELSRYQLQKSESQLATIKENNPTLFKLLQFQISFARNGILSTQERAEFQQIPEKQLNKKNKILYNLTKGDDILFSKLSKDSLAFNHYNTAYTLSITQKDTALICESLKKLVHYIHKYNRDTATLELYNSIHKKFAYNQNEKAINFYNNLILEIQKKTLKKDTLGIRDSEFHNGINLAKKASNKILEGDFYSLKGVNYGALKKKYKEAENYYKRAYEYFKPYDQFSPVRDRIKNYYIGRGAVNLNLKKYDDAIFFLDQIKISDQYVRNKRDISSLYFWYHKVYLAKEDYKNAHKYLSLRSKLNDSINQAKSNISIAKIKEQYENEKLRADNFKMGTWLTGSVIFILILSGYSYRSRKKQIIIKKEKELATQKNLTLLKEQEIISINAMIAGQEKERKRVAEDLHDNLGSVIATLKMHFDNLRLNRELKKVDQETLFDKTEGLIEETYQKVRNMAHAKNAGVIANQGLLVAVKLMAEKVSSANALKIDVVDYGLDKPLENSLELTIFRIIQELTTNIIKHSQASQATINISHDEDDITVLIEDNGIGMNASQIDVHKGMGLHSIKTRVEHLEGSFTIDSTPTKGTTIIINIPT